MTTAYSSLLGFALPQTGDLSGTWGDTVNNSVTQLVEDSVAGVATQSVAGGDWTLTDTGIGLPNQARCAILIPTGSPGAPRNIVAPSRSKAYFVINQSNNTVTVKGGATTGVTLAVGERAVVAWSGSDFVKVATSATGVTSVGLSMPSGFSVTNSPVTTSGTLTVTTALSGVLKGTGSGITAASAGTDYAPPTSGASILYGNNAGGFSNVTIGSNLTFAGGVLSASGSTGVSSVTASAPIASSGGATPNISLSSSGVSPGTYSNPTLSVDTYGRITSITGGGAGPVTSVNVNAPIVNTGSSSAPVIGIDLTNIVSINTQQTITARKYHTDIQAYGTTSTAVAINNTNIYSVCASGTDSALYLDSGASSTGCAFILNRTVGNMLIFQYGSNPFAASTVGTISTNGSTITFSGNALSDARWKEDIQPIDNALEAICAVDFVKFKYKENGRSSAGVTAQQAQTVKAIAPFVIDGASEEAYKAFDYDALVGYLGKALQEAVAKIEALEARVKALGG